MSSYFEFSQQVRREIESSEQMMPALKRYFFDLYVPANDFIGSGSANDIYRIGKLKSGLWVALRERYGSDDSPFFLGLYEVYAKKAELLQQQNKRVTKFCVGVSGNGRAGLLVQDFTNGGESPLISTSGDAAYFADNTGEIVYVDLDNVIHPETELKYLAENARIRL